MGSGERRYRLLAVDDDPAALNLVKRFAAKLDYLEFEGHSSPAGALAWSEENHFEVALLDFRMPEMNGIELAQTLMLKHPDSYFLIMSAYAEFQAAVAGIRAGIFDFLIKPFDLKEFEMAMKRVKKSLDLKSQNVMLREFLQTRSGKESFLGASQHTLAIREKVKLYSKSDAPVLITGETGVGKEIISRAIHESSERRAHPFVAVNCVAYAENLLESELFGHEKGAFTGADQKRIGRLEHAGGGTILLDEVCEIPPSMQVKLLRVLQEREFEMVGSNRPIQLKARIIAATNRDVEEEIAANRFRKDLYYRLNTLNIVVVPIRERVEDIRVLAEYFLKKFALVYSKDISGFQSAAMETIMQSGWPGNVRQLESAIEYAVLCCDKELVELEHLPRELVDGAPLQPAEPAGAHIPVSVTIQDDDNDISSVISSMEIERIEQSLAKNRWNKSKTAKELGLTRSQLTYRIKKYDLDA